MTSMRNVMPAQPSPTTASTFELGVRFMHLQNRAIQLCRLVWTCAWIMFFVAAGRGQAPDAVPFNLFDLPRLKTFSAHRVSSDNRFVPSNDDSKRIMPGETLVMADLRGPGVVNHIWITVADNEYAWPRLVRLRVYYDGKKTPSVDVPLGDFFGVGHGYERNVESLPIRDSSYGRAH